MADPAFGMYEQYQSLGMARVERCLIEREEEGQFLEFKELLDSKGNKFDYKGGKLDNATKRTLAEYMGGFANGEGGLLIWGIKANNDVAEGKSPIPNVKALRLEMEDLTSKLLDPPIDGVRHLAIEDPAEPGSGYIVTYVPEGKVKPHQSVAAGQFSFFLRTNASTTVMRTPTVRAYMVSGARPSLKVRVEPRHLEYRPSRIGPNGLFQGSNAGLYITFRVFIENDGTALAEQCAVAVSSQAGLSSQAVHMNAGGTPIKVAHRGQPEDALLFDHDNIRMIYPGNRKFVNEFEFTDSTVNANQRVINLAQDVLFRFWVYARNFSSYEEVLIEAGSLYALAK